MESGGEADTDQHRLPSQIRSPLRLAAAKRDLTIRRNVLAAIEERLREDLGNDVEGIGGLMASAHSVLAGLWDNRKDAKYDRS